MKLRLEMVRGDMDSIKGEIECNQQIRSPDKFIKGDLVLLSHSGIKLHPDKPKSSCYGPFTIERLCENEATILVNRKGRMMTVRSQQLRFYHKDDEHSTNGDVILSDEVT